ncbi:MAG TPA: hypothetical protein VJN94_16945 [Candidatus Binataceae bacterium]|nr:hypothetical protein [Candidatus Binataceae bacterium]
MNGGTGGFANATGAGSADVSYAASISSGFSGTGRVSLNGDILK